MIKNNKPKRNSSNLFKDIVPDEDFIEEIYFTGNSAVVWSNFYYAIRKANSFFMLLSNDIVRFSKEKGRQQ